MSLKSYRYIHPRLKQTLEDISVYLQVAIYGHIIFYIGASRTGKTTGMEAIRDKYVAEGKRVLYLLAPKKSAHQFSWKPLCSKILESLGYPLARSINRITTDSLWSLIYDYLKDQKIDLILLDDADILNSSVQSQTRNDIIQDLKTLAQESSAQLVISGTHHLQSLVIEEGQLSNRSNVTYFDPYDISIERDYKALMLCLSNFSAQLEVKLSQKVMSNPGRLFELSNGCVGSIAERLRIAEGFSKQQKSRLIKYSQIEKAYLNIDPDGKRQTEINTIKNQRKGILN